MTTARKHPDTFWRKATYIAANDNNAVALYRMFIAALLSFAVAILTYNGSEFASTQKAQGILLADHSTSIELLRQDHIRDQSATNERLKMLEDRDIRILDRLNLDNNRLTAVETVQALAGVMPARKR